MVKFEIEYLIPLSVLVIIYYILFCFLVFIIRYLIKMGLLIRFAKIKSRYLVMFFLLGLVITPVTYTIAYTRFYTIRYELRMRSFINHLKEATKVEAMVSSESPLYLFDVEPNSYFIDEENREVTEAYARNYSINNRINIEKFADSMSEDAYTLDIMTWLPSSYVRVNIFRNDLLLDDFTLYDWSHINFGDKFILTSKDNVLCRLHNLSPILAPVILRAKSGEKLNWLYHGISWFNSRGDEHPDPREYPNPNKWCDQLLAYSEICAQITGDEEWAGPVKKENFIFDDIDDGPCHYAMNPNCEPNSPPNTVLLFETKAGWNQLGGLEILTTEYHKPRGCMVLFNDGSVRFIPTEKIHELKW